MKKYCLFVIIFLCPLVAYSESDLKGKLLNYDFDRIKIAISARSMITDLIKKSEFDSVSMIISYCDSVNYPDSSWLSKKERFLIYYLKADTSFLLSKAVYKKYLNLRDTRPDDDYYNQYLFYNDEFASSRFLLEKTSYLTENFPNFRLNMNIEDLGKILKLFAVEKRQIIRKKYPSLDDLWDFLDLVLNFDLINYEEIGQRGNSFLAKYPKSNFRDLIAYNFANKYKASKKGGSLFATILRYNTFPDKTNAWIDDYPAVGLGFGYIYKHISLVFDLSFLTVDAKSSLSYGKDTLSDTLNINPFTFELSLGYIINIHNSYYVTPAIVFENFTATPISSTGKSIDFNIPTSRGLGLSLTVDKRIHKSVDAFWGSVVSGKVGVTYNDFTNIRPDLGIYYYYASIGLGIKGWARTRDYSF